MAEGEQRTHDHLAAHPRVSGGEQARTGTPAEIRASIRSVAEKGTDGLKILAMDCDSSGSDPGRGAQARTPDDGARRVGRNDREGLHRAGVSSIEHFCGAADAAIPGIPNYPPDMNYNDQVRRLARAGELFVQADRGSLSEIVGLLVEHRVG